MSPAITGVTQRAQNAQTVSRGVGIRPRSRGLGTLLAIIKINVAAAANVTAINSLLIVSLRRPQAGEPPPVARLEHLRELLRLHRSARSTADGPPRCCLIRRPIAPQGGPSVPFDGVSCRDRRRPVWRFAPSIQRPFEGSPGRTVLRETARRGWSSQRSTWDTCNQPNKRKHYAFAGPGCQRICGSSLLRSRAGSGVAK
jgi:hypothetical protein